MNMTEFDRHDFIYSFGQVWKRVMTDPRGFFLAMPRTGGLGNPLMFAVLCLAIAGFGFLITGGGFRLGVGLIFGGVIRLFISAALFLLIARWLFEGKGDFAATFRVCAYTAAPAVLLWVPVVKYLALLYMAYLLIVGLQRTHEFDSVKAVLTLVIATVVGGFLALAFGGPRWLWSSWRLLR